MTFKPLGDRILIEQLEAEDKTSGGIIIPDTAKEKPLQGRVLAVGSGAKDENGKVIPLEIKVGDIIVYGQWGTNEIKLNGKPHLIIKEGDVLGVIEK